MGPRRDRRARADARPPRRAWCLPLRPALGLGLGLLAFLVLPACAAPTGAAAPPAPPLVVASDLDNLPFAGVDAEGRPMGRDVEMMEALAARIGRTIEWRRVPFDTLLPAAGAGLVDVVCATVGITPERAVTVDFSEPYFETVISAVVRSGSGEPQRWRDLDGRPVAAARGTTSERAVERVLPRAVGVFENKSGLSAAERLLMGEVDAAVMDGPAARALIDAAGGTLALMDTPLAIERYALALPKDRGLLREALDHALAGLRQAGELARLDERWGLRGESR